jgi:hypothetical protein
MRYVGREGALGLETDGGEHITGKDLAKELLEDWNLDLDAHRRQTARGIVTRKTPKLVHNLFFSMPPGTDPDRVLRAVRKLAANEWQLKHRHVMVLHTDEPHPHVHVILKARNEQGVRLNIRKATLRNWRAQFATNLRELGVDAKATERAVRGLTRTHKPAGIYRAAQRGESIFTRQRQQAAREAHDNTGATASRGHAAMLETRRSVLRGFEEVAQKARAEGDERLADEIRHFVDRMPPVRTEQKLVAEAISQDARARTADTEPPTR